MQNRGLNFTNYLLPLLLSSFLTISASHASAQDMSCCAKKPAPELAMYSDPGFIATHEAPLPFKFVPSGGDVITFKTANGPDAHAYLVKGSKDARSVVLLFHEWWGLNDYIKQEAEDFQKRLGENVDVLALDLFDGKVTDKPDEASKLVTNVSSDRIKAIIQGALDFEGPHKRVGTLGWCFGGGWSLQAALMAGPSLAGCVMYYGMPDLDTSHLMKLRGPVLGFFGLKDQYITPTKVAQFKEAMHEVNKLLTVKTYNDDHAFANPSNPHFDKAAKDESERIAMEFLGRRL